MYIYSIHPVYIGLRTDQHIYAYDDANFSPSGVATQLKTLFAEAPSGSKKV